MFEEVGLETPKKEEYDGQYEQYLNYLLSSRAFPNPSDAAKKASQSMNAKDSIEIAMDMEKDALLFYGEIVKLIPDTHAKYVEDIIAEERGHLQDLYAIWEQL
jgi:rubrerythrin